MAPIEIGKIRIHFSTDGRLPENVVTRRGIESKRGWYAITPNGVAHRGHCWHCSRRLVTSWLHNFANDAPFWYDLKRDRHGR